MNYATRLRAGAGPSGFRGPVIINGAVRAGAEPEGKWQHSRSRRSALRRTWRAVDVKRFASTHPRVAQNAVLRFLLAPIPLRGRTHKQTHKKMAALQGATIGAALHMARCPRGELHLEASARSTKCCSALSACAYSAAR